MIKNSPGFFATAVPANSTMMPNTIHSCAIVYLLSSDDL